MKTIEINGKSVKVSKDLQRALLILRDREYITLKGSFETGSGGRNMGNLVTDESESTLAEIGISIRYLQIDNLRGDSHHHANKFSTATLRAFKAEHPRAYYAVTGTSRRVKSVLKKLGLSTTPGDWKNSITA